MNPKNGFFLNLGAKEKILFFLVMVSAVFLFLLFSSFSAPKEQPARPINIVSVSPPNNTQKVSINPQLAVNFSRKLDSKDLTKIDVRSSPQSFLQTSLSGNKKSILLTPASPLLLNQEYVVTITYGEKQNYIWKIKTVSAQDLGPENQAKNQAEADKKTGQIMEDVDKKYPWYKNLPLLTQEYFVYFDLKNEKFIAKIYVKKTAPVDENGVLKTKDVILSALKNIGVDTDRYEIEWNVVGVN